MKNTEVVIPKIVEWLKEKSTSSKTNGFVIGVSGGIDSALVSTLCVKTSLPVTAISMPIHQEKSQLSRADEQLSFLTTIGQVDTLVVDLTHMYEIFKSKLPGSSPFSEETVMTDLALANTRSRLRMVTLYAFANSRRALVAGTGNKVEDYGVGFFTKYGDGGVDLSPIGDLTKTEVRACAKFLGIPQSILEAKPTDGLWGDNRSDEDQIGASYEELEWAMELHDKIESHAQADLREYGKFDDSSYLNPLTPRQREVLSIYRARHYGNAHKMKMPPVCILS